jgi:hypothetical protein
MCGTIHFHYQACSNAVEVGDEPTDGVLAPKAQTVDAPGA